MPIIDGVIYLDNTYARDVATCSTLAYVMRVCGYQPVNANLDAANVGNVFHKALEVYFSTGSAPDALDAFEAEYDRLLPPTEQSAWDNWQPRRSTNGRNHNRDRKGAS